MGIIKDLDNKWGGKRGRPVTTASLLLAAVGMWFSLQQCGKSPKNDVVIRKDTSAIQLVHTLEWDSLFSSRNVEGTVILYRPESKTMKVHDYTRARKRYCPASTFKIFNSMASLEAKAVNSINDTLKWDGEKRFYDKWNMDQTMRTAMRYSCVWFYQEMARRVGKEKMQQHLSNVGYGNDSIGGKVDEFWLDGSIQISAEEQVKFLKRLIDRDLPFRPGVMDSVERIMLLDSGDSWKMHAKTGWSVRLDKHVGWFVGYVLRDKQPYIFALNIDMVGMKDTPYRKDIVYDILKAEGIID